MNKNNWNDSNNRNDNKNNNKRNDNNNWNNNNNNCNNRNNNDPYDRSRVKDIYQLRIFVKSMIDLHPSSGVATMKVGRGCVGKLVFKKSSTKCWTSSTRSRSISVTVQPPKPPPVIREPYTPPEWREKKILSIILLHTWYGLILQFFPHTLSVVKSLISLHLCLCYVEIRLKQTKCKIYD